MSSIHHGRGSEAKGIHFYQTIQLRELQDHELMIPRNFVERYWKNVSNPISLKLPNESVCKMFWVQLGDDIWLLNWKRFARSLRCGELLVFQYRGGSEFHVIILDDSKLEIDYSSIRCNDEQEAEESDDDNYVEKMNDSENAEQPLKKKKINLNDSVTTAATPPGTKIDNRKINMNATQKKVLEANRNIGGRGKKAKNCTKTEDANKRSCNNSDPGENPNFTLTLSRCSVDGDQLRLRIPSQFSKEYMNELLQGNATIRSVGEDRTWYLNLCFDKRSRDFYTGAGWKSFAQGHKLQVGDVCKFEMSQREPLSFTITIVRATKEPCPDPKQFQEAIRNRGGRVKKAMKCTKTKDVNKRSCNSSHPGDNSNFTVKLTRSYVVGDPSRLNIPSQFSKEYMNELLQGIAMIRSIGEDRTWNVKLHFDKRNNNFKLVTGWKSFVEEHNLQVGDVCNFEMTQREPLSFTITIDRATEEPCPDPEQFQGCGHSLHIKSETSPIENMDYVGNYGEGTSRSCLKDSVCPNSHYKFKAFVTSLDKLVIPNEFLKRHNLLSRNSVELKVGEGTWFVEVSYNQHHDYGWFNKGWPEFVKECKVKIGDTCLFKMIDDENHVFSVSIILDV